MLDTFSQLLSQVHVFRIAMQQEHAGIHFDTINSGTTKIPYILQRSLARNQHHRPAQQPLPLNIKIKQLPHVLMYYKARISRLHRLDHARLVLFIAAHILHRR